jgi:hypothetical protein
LAFGFNQALWWHLFDYSEKNIILVDEQDFMLVIF